MRTSRAVELFMLSREAAHRAESTIRWYRWILGSFQYNNKHLPKKPEPIERWLSSKTGEPETISGYYRALSAFYAWLAKRRHIKRNPMAGVDPPLIPDKIPFIYTLELLAKVVQATHDWTIRLLIVLLANTGIRLGEARDLNRSDLGDGLIIVRGKTGMRYVPCSPYVIELLRDLEAITSDPDGIFVYSIGALPGRRGYEGRYTANTLSHKVGIARKAAGVTAFRASAHALRHTFGTLWEGDETVLQSIFGHTTLEMTKRYRRYRIGRAQQQHTLFAPLTDPNSITTAS